MQFNEGKVDHMWKNLLLLLSILFIPTTLYAGGRTAQLTVSENATLCDVLTVSTTIALYKGNELATTSDITTPGGSDTQMQYNNSGSFGGVGSLTVSGSTVSYNGVEIATTESAANPGGSDTEVQFNNSGTLDGIDSLTVSGSTVTYNGKELITGDAFDGVTIFSGSLGAQIDHDSANTAVDHTWWATDAAATTVINTKFTKIPSFDTVTWYARGKADTGPGDDVTVTVTIGGQSSSDSATTTSYTWLSNTIDVSSLTDGTVYDVTVGLGGNNAADKRMSDIIMFAS